MGIWLSRHVPVLPIQTPDGEGGHDARHGDSQQERYGEEGAGGTAREDEGREAEDQGPRAGCAACGARRGEGLEGWRKWWQVVVEAVVSTGQR